MDGTRLLEFSFQEEAIAFIVPCDTCRKQSITSGTSSAGPGCRAMWPARTNRPVAATPPPSRRNSLLAATKRVDG